MKKVRFLRYGISEGLNNLVRELESMGVNVKRLKLPTSRYTGRLHSHVVINWGRSNRDSINPGKQIINHPDAVKIASNKLHTFQKLRDAGLSSILPTWSTNNYEAAEWLRSGETEAIYSRQLLRASGGRGIHISTTISGIPLDGQLYVAKVDVSREVRVHVMAGKVIDFAQKKKRRGEEANSDIRSYSNGWIFAREGVDIPSIIREAAIDAVSALGLDFGAVDIGIDVQGLPKIYEINTAPGVVGTSVTNYANTIIEEWLL
jgi:glutathione synthase/RimK-type ligase-like ATP-grasp enzyme